MTKFHRPLLGCALAVWAAAGCDSPDPIVEFEPPPPGLSAAPQWLTFICIDPECASTRTATVSVVGERALAVRRVVLSDEDPAFAVRLKTPAPFIVEPGDSFEVEIDHLPSGSPPPEDPSVRIAYTDASPVENDDRIPPGELEIPLVRRRIGEARLEVSPDRLNLGVVAPGQTRGGQLELTNVGFGTVGLVISEVRSEPSADIQIGPLPSSIPAGGKDALDVSWSPPQEQFLQGSLSFTLAGSVSPPVTVPVVGTSIQSPRVAFEPGSDIEFGPVAVGQSKQVTVQVWNRGGQPLTVESPVLRNVPDSAEMSLAWSPAPPESIAPLESASLVLNLEAKASDRLVAELEIRSSDPTQPLVTLPITALLSKPQAEIAPRALDFGSVPQGWTRGLPVEITNVGFGELEIRNLTFVLGSSALFTLRSVPRLPARLLNGERIAFEVEFRSEAAASFSGSLAVESNDAERPFQEVSLAARGATCEDGCPIQNGVPDCSSGMCAVGSCDARWYDADLDPATGCECQDPDTRGDPGEFCAQAIYLGSLNDGNGDSASFTGVIPVDGDLDLIRFHARDTTQIFSDAYDVRIQLQTADPDLQMCVYRHNTGDHLNECFLENEVCGIRSFRRDGSFGPDDAADYTIRVFRRPGAAPNCTSYTLFARNG
ncbi:MAG: choice-of-anchor D domain-containing protein [Myxococcota bacterium]